ncbi:MAG TPA: PQQ-dependent dehydrogenase, methanol/ethanol family [Vicinamibacterales bacterium]|nr:PQQ-dependent dehydrogenase, methanol/ethanol family [Vicinamibacterales bacterium]
MRYRFSAVIAVLSLAAAACAGHPTESVDDARLAGANADAGNWLTYGRTYDEQRFSPLTQISDATVARLGLVWSVDLPTSRGLEATPLVVDGVLYTTSSWSVTYAFDAATGAQLWTYDPDVDRTRVRSVCCDVVNRGLALYKGNLYLGTLDGRLVAIDARTGVPVWDVLTIDPAKPYAITGAPRIARGRVLIGNAGAEFGVRGYISAYDAATGELAWRAYSVPGDPALGFESPAMEAAAGTWSGEYWKTGGGGTTWDPIVYDPELDQVYFGTGNGTAWYRDLRSPGGGDNLYLASIIAVRAETGEHVWHYQVTPGDHWDYDATQPLMQATLTIDGAPRKVLMQASKNGFFYVLDRVTGKLISGTQFVDGVTWATGIDSITGRPIESPSAYAGMEPVLVSPDPEGAHNWNPMAMDPVRGLVFLGARASTVSVHAPDRDWEYDPAGENVGYDVDYDGELMRRADAAPPPRGELLAWDPVQQREAWRVPLPASQSGGVLATAGNLVFQGRADGLFAAYRASDGEKLWEFDAGTGIMAPPVTYLAGGAQYVTVMVGWGGPMGLWNPSNIAPVKPGYGRVVTFALDATARLDVPVYGHSEPPVPAIELDATAATIAQGKVLYDEHCVFCHGADVIAGPVADLRYSPAAVHEQLEAIVLGGAFEQLGMPAFDDKLTPADLSLIQAYIVSRAAAARR